MQKFSGKDIVAKFYQGKVISAVYHGLMLVWIAVRSCFGSGVWIDEKPWLDEEQWKDNS